VSLCLRRPKRSGEPAVESKVMLRYCGGCNPRYDRVAAVNSLKKRFPHLIFCPYEPGERGCAVLIVCGCTARCPAQDVPADIPVFVMSTPESLGEATAFFENIRIEETKNELAQVLRSAFDDG